MQHKRKTNHELFEEDRNKLAIGYRLSAIGYRLILGVLLSVFAFILQPAYAQKKPQTVAVKESVKDIHSNSLNAPSIINVFKEIQSQVNAVKDDPFDPNGSKKIKALIYAKYTGKVFFIPMGDGEGSQKLAGLSYQVENRKINFYPFDTYSDDKGLSYYYRVDSEGCGAIKYRGYGVSASTVLKNASSDFGDISSKNSNEGRSYSYVEITNLPVEQARSLSGQIERYVTFKNITDAYSPRDSNWGPKGSPCKDIFLIDALSGTFEYNFRDKNTGKSLLRFELRDN